ncbi:putative cathepsin E [Mycena galopus ATCC 62051]|nr:putative cathepsin E [Mycena galopus ATCC 62051]
MAYLTSPFLFLACLVAAAASTPVSAPNVLSVPIHKKVSGSAGNLKALVETDLSRFNLSRRSVGEEPAANHVSSYLAAIEVGSQTFDLCVDTGSSNTWVGAGTRYSPGPTSRSTGKAFSVGYGSESVSGTEYTDTVVIGGLTVTNQSIGDGTRSSGFSGVDGIIGFGPVDLTEGTVSGSSTVPTVMDNLYSQGTISTEVLGISFAPDPSSGSEPIVNGELTLGGTDSTKFTGAITYVPRTSVSPYSLYWGITVSSITYNGKSIGGPYNSVVDTGTTLVIIPTTAYNAFLSASGGKTDASTGFSSWTTLPTNDLTFTIGGIPFTLTPSQYTIPTAQYAFWGLRSGKYYGWIYNGGAVNANINFIIGQKFLENYYSVFDTTNNQVGFATPS